MSKLIITAAICGAEVTKAHNPAVPYTALEIAEEAERAYDQGASIIHLHVREDDGTPTQRRERFAECIEAIKEKCPKVIIQPSTGGAVGMSDDERLEPIYLKPEMATLDCGTMNFGGDDIFINTQKSIIYFAKKMQALNIKPELEVFDKSMVDMALHLEKKGYIQSPLHFDFVMGVRGGIGATLRDFCFLRGSIPADATFTAAGVGRHQFNVAAMAALSGGHIRVGFEDNIYISHKKLARSNGELVEKAARIARDLDRAIATPCEARAILNLK